MKEQWAETKFRRTKSWKSQPEFDNLLANTTISGLEYLQIKHESDLNNYTLTHDLNCPEYFSEYKQKQQQLKMINDELTHRWVDIWASPTYYGSKGHSFDSTTGIVWSEDFGLPKYTADFNENETGYVIRNLEGGVVDKWELNSEDKIKDLTRADIYSGWKYWKEDNEEIDNE